MLCGKTRLRPPAVEFASCRAAPGPGAGGYNLRYHFLFRPQSHSASLLVLCLERSGFFSPTLSSSSTGLVLLLCKSRHAGMCKLLCFGNCLLSWLYKLSPHCFNAVVCYCQCSVTWVTKHTHSMKIPGELCQGLHWLPIQSVSQICCILCINKHDMVTFSVPKIHENSLRLFEKTKGYVKYVLFKFHGAGLKPAVSS